MKYNSTAVQPACYLMTEEHGEQAVTLEELQVTISHFHEVLDLHLATSLILLFFWA
jgi:hypothetical protein